MSFCSNDDKIIKSFVTPQNITNTNRAIITADPTSFVVKLEAASENKEGC